MDVSLKWQMDHLFPEKKIIIWAATAHFIRNNRELRSTATYKQAGDYSFNRLGNDMYTIACTTFSGTVGFRYHEFDDRANNGAGAGDTIPSPVKGSYEYWAHTAKKNFLFTDLRSADKNDWIKKDFGASCLGFVPDKGPWYRVTDAFMFIDTMYPVERITKGK